MRLRAALLLVCAVVGLGSEALAHTYRVRQGDTVAEIARRMGVSQRALRRANRLDERALITVGQELQIPPPRAERRWPPPANPRLGSIDMAYALLSGPPTGRLRKLHGPGPRHPRSLRFPTPRNVIGRGYGQGRRGGHRALDLGARMGDSIWAAEDGIVGFAGRFGGYGNVVMIAHPGGAVTVYGHLARARVRAGRRVRRGQVIGRAGSTGNSLGPHLHFELRVDGRPIDPSALFDSRPAVAGPPPGLRRAAEAEAAAAAAADHGMEIDDIEGDPTGSAAPEPGAAPVIAPAAPR